MKNKLILWISSFLIVFISAYLKNIFSENYPITGTIGINGLKLTYKLDKEGYGDNHKLLLRSDNSDINAFAVFITDSLIKNELYKEGNFFVAKIDRKVTGKKFSYYLIIKNKDNYFRIPKEDNVNFIFYGKISTMLFFIYYLFLYAAILLIVRSGLEYFNNNLLTRKFLVLSNLVWLTFVALISPLYLSYKFEYINHIIPSIESLFRMNQLLILILLIIGLCLSFIKKFCDKPIALFISVLIIILFMF